MRKKFRKALRHWRFYRGNCINLYHHVLFISSLGSGKIRFVRFSHLLSVWSKGNLFPNSFVHILIYHKFKFVKQLKLLFTKNFSRIEEKTFESSRYQRVKRFCGFLVFHIQTYLCFQRFRVRFRKQKEVFALREFFVDWFFCGKTPSKLASWKCCYMAGRKHHCEQCFTWVRQCRTQIPVNAERVSL